MLLGSTYLTRFSRLVPQSNRPPRTAPAARCARSAHPASRAEPALFRVTPGGRSLTIVSLLRSFPVCTLKGGAELAVKSHDAVPATQEPALRRLHRSAERESMALIVIGRGDVPERARSSVQCRRNDAASPVPGIRR